MNYVTKATVLGARKLLDASLSGETVPLAKVKFGDGLGEEYEPTGGETHLKHIVCTVIPTAPSDTTGPQISIKATIPADEGGFTVREFGVFDTDDEMIFIGNLPSTPKVIGQNGYIDDIAITINVDAGHTNVITFQIDPAFALASQAYVDERLAHDHDAQYLLKSETAKNSEKLDNKSVSEIMQGTITNPIYLGDINIKSPPLAAGFYYQMSSVAATVERGYPIVRAGSLEVTKSSSRGVAYTYKEYDSGETYTCGCYNEVWSNWQRLFDTSNPPSAAQVGAVSLSGTAANASKLDNKTRAELVAEARSGLLSTSGTAANASKLENKTKSQVVAEAKTGLIPSTSGNHAFSGALISNNRDEGVFGVYDSTKIDHIWSMGEAYKIDPNGENLGSLYGFAYYHSNNGSYGNLAGNHQAIWASNGVPQCAIGSNLWTVNNVYEQNQLLRDRYLAIGARAQDSYNLMGYPLSSSEDNNTVVLRNGAGNVLAHEFYQGGKSLANTYLGKTAKAQDSYDSDNSAKVAGMSPTYAATPSTVMSRTSGGDSYLRKLTASAQDFTRNTESFTDAVMGAGDLFFRAQGSIAMRLTSVSDFIDYLISVLPTSSGGTGGGSGGGTGCFALGTKVLLSNGQETAMETLKTGDAIRAFSHPVLATGRNDESWRLASAANLDGGLLSTAIVKNVMLNSYDNYYLINNSLEVTYEHPLLTYSPRFNDWRWLAAEHIQVGDKILAESGEMINIDSHVFIDAPLNTVNIDVEELDNYFVKLGEHWLLAHNANKD